MQKRRYDSSYETAATAARRHLSNYRLPGPAATEALAFTNIEWRLAPVFRGIGAVMLYQTKNGRHWAAVQAEPTHPPSRRGMAFTTYAGRATNAAAIFFDGVHPAHSSSWQRQNIIESPPASEQVYNTILNLGAALAIMQMGGDIGKETPPLYPVRIAHHFTPEPPDERSTGFVSEHYPQAGIAIVDTAHLHAETTSIYAACGEDDASYIDMSMFGHPTPNGTTYIEGLLAATVIHMHADAAEA